MLLLDCDNIVYSVSCTTRAARGEEEDGSDYYFISQDAFDQKVAQDEFLEHANVHGNWYGTLKQTVRNALEHNHDIVMDIDVEGARQLRQKVMAAGDKDPIRAAFVDVFIRAPSLEVQETRLRDRNEDNEETIQQRLINARAELEFEGEFSRMIVNDNLQIAYQELVHYILEKKKTV